MFDGAVDNAEWGGRALTMDQARATKDPMIGRVLLGRYRIVRELAKGGMGIVYLARAEGAVGFVKPVVVKLILQEFAEDQRYMGMFAREAQILSNLRDPSIVDVIEFGEEAGNYVMVLEYVRGYHLGQWKRYLKRKGRTIPTESALQIAIDVLQALHHAHGARHPDGESMHIVHRDVSPSNILLDSNGRARLLDFGVARMRGGSHGYKTQVKGFVGKDQYIAPEIFAGVDASPQSDLYACGVVLHEVLFGENVFRARTQAATLHRVLHHVPEPVTARRLDAPTGLDGVLARALAKTPEDRYQSAAEFAEALRSLLPRSEHVMREELSQLLATDFTEEMAATLGIESLTARDEAWRRFGARTGAAGQALASEPPTVAGAPAGGAVVRAPATSSNVHEDRTRVQQEEGPTVVSSVDLVTPEPAEGPKTVATPRSLRPPPAVALPLVPPPAAGPPPKPPIVGAMTVPGPVSDAPASEPSRWMVYSLIGVALLAVTAIALSLGGGRAPAPAAPSIRVVQQPLPEAAATTPAEAIEPSAPAPPPESPTSEPPTKAPKPAPTERPAPRARRGPDGASLTRAFRRRQADVRRCMEDLGTPAAAQARMEVEFRLASDGRVEQARVLPPALAKTEVGQCVLQVAKTTRFPAQGEAVEFAIPVTTRLVK